MAAGDPTTNALDYAYKNPIPGAPKSVTARDSDGLPTTTTARTTKGALPEGVVVTVGPQALSNAAFQDAVSSPTETTHYALNPAFDPAHEVVGQSLGIPAPESAEPYGGADTDNPVADQMEREDEPAPTDHSAQLPGAPTTVAAVAGDAGHATVTWVAPEDADGYDLTGFTVTATSSDGGTSPVHKAVAGNLLTADVSGLTSAKHYTFTVHATNVAGDGPESAATEAVAIAS